MRAILTFISSLGCSAFLLTAHAQTPATTHDNPSPAKPTTKTADQRAAAYKGPKVLPDSKTLGHKMIQKSKPTDMRVPLPVPPVKQ